jgi:predicted unusual protein kinase regulating ubiquinone biosynthesis (AarF/ABC1/UbiB family)
MNEIYDGVYKDLTIKSIAQDDDAFGIVHGDVHGGNVKINSGIYTFYDFDMTSRFPYAVDLGPIFL